MVLFFCFWHFFVSKNLFMDCVMKGLFLFALLSLLLHLQVCFFLLCMFAVAAVLLFLFWFFGKNILLLCFLFCLLWFHCRVPGLLVWVVCCVLTHSPILSFLPSASHDGFVLQLPCGRARSSCRSHVMWLCLTIQQNLVFKKYWSLYAIRSKMHIAVACDRATIRHGNWHPW